MFPPLADAVGNTLNFYNFPTVQNRYSFEKINFKPSKYLRLWGGCVRARFQTKKTEQQTTMQCDEEHLCTQFSRALSVFRE